MSIADLFMHQILTALDIDKDEILPMVKNIGSTVQQFDAKLTRIEENQIAIIRAIGIQPQENEEPENENEFATDDISDTPEIPERSGD